MPTHDEQQRDAPSDRSTTAREDSQRATPSEQQEPQPPPAQPQAVSQPGQTSSAGNSSSSTLATSVSCPAAAVTTFGGESLSNSERDYTTPDRNARRGRAFTFESSSDGSKYSYPGTIVSISKQPSPTATPGGSPWGSRLWSNNAPHVSSKASQYSVPELQEEDPHSGAAFTNNSQTYLRDPDHADEVQLTGEVDPAGQQELCGENGQQGSDGFGRPLSSTSSRSTSSSVAGDGKMNSGFQPPPRQTSSTSSSTAATATASSSSWNVRKQSSRSSATRASCAAGTTSFFADVSNNKTTKPSVPEASSSSGAVEKLREHDSSKLVLVLLQVFDQWALCLEEEVGLATPAAAGAPSSSIIAPGSNASSSSSSSSSAIILSPETKPEKQDAKAAAATGAALFDLDAFLRDPAEVLQKWKPHAAGTTSATTNVMSGSGMMYTNTCVVPGNPTNAEQNPLQLQGMGSTTATEGNIKGNGRPTRSRNGRRTARQLAPGLPAPPENSLLIPKTMADFLRCSRDLLDLVPGILIEHVLVVFDVLTDRLKSDWTVREAICKTGLVRYLVYVLKMKLRSVRELLEKNASRANETQASRRESLRRRPSSSGNLVHLSGAPGGRPRQVVLYEPGSGGIKVSHSDGAIHGSMSETADEFDSGTEVSGDEEQNSGLMAQPMEMEDEKWFDSADHPVHRKSTNSLTGGATSSGKKRMKGSSTKSDRTGGLLRSTNHGAAPRGKTLRYEIDGTTSTDGSNTNMLLADHDGGTDGAEEERIDVLQYLEAYAKNASVCYSLLQDGEYSLAAVRNLFLVEKILAFLREFFRELTIFSDTAYLPAKCIADLLGLVTSKTMPWNNVGSANAAAPSNEAFNSNRTSNGRRSSPSNRGTTRGGSGAPNRLAPRAWTQPPAQMMAPPQFQGPFFDGEEVVGGEQQGAGGFDIPQNSDPFSQWMTGAGHSNYTDQQFESCETGPSTSTSAGAGASSKSAAGSSPAVAPPATGAAIDLSITRCQHLPILSGLDVLIEYLTSSAAVSQMVLDQEKRQSRNLGTISLEQSETNAASSGATSSGEQTGEQVDGRQRSGENTTDQVGRSLTVDTTESALLAPGAHLHEQLQTSVSLDIRDDGAPGNSSNFANAGPSAVLDMTEGAAHDSTSNLRSSSLAPEDVTMSQQPQSTPSGSVSYSTKRSTAATGSFSGSCSSKAGGRSSKQHSLQNPLPAEIRFLDNDGTVENPFEQRKLAVPFFSSDAKLSECWENCLLEVNALILTLLDRGTLAFTSNYMNQSEMMFPSSTRNRNGAPTNVAINPHLFNHVGEQQQREHPGGFFGAPPGGFFGRPAGEDPTTRGENQRGVRVLNDTATTHVVIPPPPVPVQAGQVPPARYTRDEMLAHHSNPHAPLANERDQVTAAPVAATAGGAPTAEEPAQQNQNRDGNEPVQIPAPRAVLEQELEERAGESSRALLRRNTSTMDSNMNNPENWFLEGFNNYIHEEGEGFDPYENDWPQEPADGQGQEPQQDRQAEREPETTPGRTGSPEDRPNVAVPPQAATSTRPRSGGQHVDEERRPAATRPQQERNQTLLESVRLDSSSSSSSSSHDDGGAAALQPLPGIITGNRPNLLFQQRDFVASASNQHVQIFGNVSLGSESMLASGTTHNYNPGMDDSLVQTIVLNDGGARGQDLDGSDDHSSDSLVVTRMNNGPLLDDSLLVPRRNNSGETVTVPEEGARGESSEQPTGTSNTEQGQPFGEQDQVQIGDHTEAPAPGGNVESSSAVESRNGAAPLEQAVPAPEAELQTNDRERSRGVVSFHDSSTSSSSAASPSGNHSSAGARGPIPNVVNTIAHAQTQSTSSSAAGAGAVVLPGTTDSQAQPVDEQQLDPKTLRRRRSIQRYHSVGSEPSPNRTALYERPRATTRNGMATSGSASASSSSHNVPSITQAGATRPRSDVTTEQASSELQSALLPQQSSPPWSLDLQNCVFQQPAQQSSSAFPSSSSSSSGTARISVPANSTGQVRVNSSPTEDARLRLLGPTLSVQEALQHANGLIAAAAASANLYNNTAFDQQEDAAARTQGQARIDTPQAPTARQIPHGDDVASEPHSGATRHGQQVVSISNGAAQEQPAAVAGAGASSSSTSLVHRELNLLEQHFQEIERTRQERGGVPAIGAGSVMFDNHYYNIPAGAGGGPSGGQLRDGQNTENNSSAGGHTAAGSMPAPGAASADPANVLAGVPHWLTNGPTYGQLAAQQQVVDNRNRAWLRPGQRDPLLAIPRNNPRRLARHDADGGGSPEEQQRELHQQVGGPLQNIAGVNADQLGNNPAPPAGPLGGGAAPMMPPGVGPGANAVPGAPPLAPMFANLLWPALPPPWPAPGEAGLREFDPTALAEHQQMLQELGLAMPPPPGAPGAAAGGNVVGPAAMRARRNLYGAPLPPIFPHHEQPNGEQDVEQTLTPLRPTPGLFAQTLTAGTFAAVSMILARAARGCTFPITTASTLSAGTCEGMMKHDTGNSNPLSPQPTANFANGGDTLPKNATPVALNLSLIMQCSQLAAFLSCPRLIYADRPNLTSPFCRAIKEKGQICDNLFETLALLMDFATGAFRKKHGCSAQSPVKRWTASTTRAGAETAPTSASSSLVVTDSTTTTGDCSSTCGSSLLFEPGSTASQPRLFDDERLVQVGGTSSTTQDQHVDDAADLSPKRSPWWSHKRAPSVEVVSRTVGDSGETFLQKSCSAGGKMTGARTLTSPMSATTKSKSQPSTPLSPQECTHIASSWMLIVECLGNVCTEQGGTVTKGTLIPDAHSLKLLSVIVNVIREGYESKASFVKSLGTKLGQRVAHFAAALLVEYLRNAMLLPVTLHQSRPGKGQVKVLPPERKPHGLAKPDPMLAKLFEDGCWADFSIIAGEERQEFRVHRCVLYAYVPYFRGLFGPTPSYSTPAEGLQRTNSQFRESMEVTFPDIPASLMQTWIRYVYSFDTELISSVEVASELLQLADRFCQAILLRDCEMFLFDHLHAGNVDVFLDLSVRCNASALLDVTSELALKLLPDKLQHNTIGVWWLRGHAMLTPDANCRAEFGCPAPQEVVDPLTGSVTVVPANGTSSASAAPALGGGAGIAANATSAAPQLSSSITTTVTGTAAGTLPPPPLFPPNTAATSTSNNADCCAPGEDLWGSVTNANNSIEAVRMSGASSIAYNSTQELNCGAQPMDIIEEEQDDEDMLGNGSSGSHREELPLLAKAMPHLDYVLERADRVIAVGFGGEHTAPPVPATGNNAEPPAEQE
ncbi:unnamed protein product [Amoebophrya sp. A120]|nr:unnamed protein product [Amoebophrya sp. A120]|eukprot:GSA120T00011644001.1